MICDRCGSRRPRSGPCPECGAPPPGSAAMRPRSGSNWGGYEDGRGDAGAGRSDGRDRRGGGPGNQGVEPGRALVPAHNDVMPVNVAAGLPALPGLPTTDEEERALGIRRPVYIPGNAEKKKRRVSSFRVVSGLLSLMLICVASCAGTALLGKSRIEGLFVHPISIHMTPVTYNFTQVPAQPTSIPGPQSKYVITATTSRNIDNSYIPVDATTHFTVGDTVYVVLQVRNVPANSTHMLSVRWFLQGIDVGLPDPAQTSRQVTKDSNAYFALTYPTPGVGMAKIYWDKPANDKGDDPNDPALAQTVYFAVEVPVPTATPTQSKTTPGATGTQTPTH
jgi:hypothetical protein